MLPRILIVDDDKRNVLLLESALKKIYDVKVAYSGEQAIEVLQSFNADVVLLDIMMPGMSGYDVCNMIREHDEWKFMKVLLVSAKVMPSDRVQGYECGADDYVLKPFNIDELRAKIKVFLRLKHREELDDLKSNLIMLIAHELRTPLTGIVGATEVLKENSKGDDENNEIFEILDGNTKRLKQFVEKIIQLSAIKKGVELHKKDISLYDIFLEAQLSLRGNVDQVLLESIRDKAQAFENIRVNVDPYFFTMALSSLINHINEDANTGPSLQFSVVQRHDFCDIHIFDENSRAQDLGSLTEGFDPLVSDDIYHYHKGNGLDMAIVYGIVRAHGGSLDIKVNHVGNRVFIITLPSFCMV